MRIGEMEDSHRRFCVVVKNGIGICSSRLRPNIAPFQSFVKDCKSSKKKFESAVNCAGLPAALKQMTFEPAKFLGEHAEALGKPAAGCPMNR